MAFKRLTVDERNYWRNRVNEVYSKYKKRIADSINITQTSFDDVKELYMEVIKERFEKEVSQINEHNFEGYYISISAPTLKSLGKDNSHERCMKIKQACKQMKDAKDVKIYQDGNKVVFQSSTVTIYELDTGRMVLDENAGLGYMIDNNNNVTEVVNVTSGGSVMLPVG